MDHADDINPDQETPPECWEFLNLHLGCCVERLLSFFLNKYGGCADIPNPVLEIILHAPVYTCEQATQLCPRPEMNGGCAQEMKNLFLKDKKKSFFLVSAAVDTEIKLKELKFAKQASFASTEALREKLKLLPGSVTPFGLLNDESSEVQFYLDPRVVAASEGGGCPTVGFHPNACHATAYMKASDFVEFVEKESSHEVHILNLD
ncbi:proX [Symbiodinium pilosum]|uniref:ProX protein n=1 Tax=Symbiodinium pilosum TaxID=2952 RepID=A0A812UBL5_SYMPI|nr:proX [Symbiodinium pilosum]